MLLQACLNGARRDAGPRAPSEVAAEARAAVAAGAGAVHVHPRRPDGSESLDGPVVAATLDALRAVVDVPVGVSTGAWIVPDAGARIRAIEGWTVLPDFASVNLHEPGSGHIAGVLLDRGVGVEAGLWTAAAAAWFAASGAVEHCLRVLVEPREQDLAVAGATVDAILAEIDGAGVPTLLHGHDATAWDLLRRAAAEGFDTRIGLEDTLVLPDGTPATTNAALVRAAVSLLGG